MKNHHIIVSHGHCPDGAAAVVVARQVCKQTEYVCGLHDRIDQQILNAAHRISHQGTLWICDISCSEDTLNKVCEILISKEVTLGIYEHHISRNFLSKYRLPDDIEGEIVFDMDRCGSKIFYDTMLERHPARLSPYTDFIRLTNDRDLWINSDVKSAELSALHSILGEDKFIQRFYKNPEVEFADSETILLEYEKDQLMRKMHRHMDHIEIKTDPEGIKYGIMVGEGKASEICNAAIHKFELEYVFMLDYNHRRASIRSREYFDCAAFASERGGGGHERAAGFPIERKDYQPY
jgi:oligoribonuclease NrnB/cAMP/cGMP phosphodiesterase (DHH superfamily)